MAMEPKIAGVIIPCRVFTQSGSKPESVFNARMSASAGCGHDSRRSFTSGARVQLGRRARGAKARRPAAMVALDLDQSFALNGRVEFLIVRAAA
jgi:hypothetical protein